MDDWWAERNSTTGDIQAFPETFPSGMTAIGQKIHAAGCKFGVYSSASERTCGNHSGSLFNEVRDANTMVLEWGIDFLKYDACIYSFGTAGRARYSAMSAALNATGKKVFYSVEGWSPEDGLWGPEVANMWRTGSDIWPKWDVCILNNLYQTNRAAQYNRYSMAAAGTLKDHNNGGFNDGDMLQPPNTLMTVSTPGLTFDESASQFKLWSCMKTPLILGINWQQLADVATLDPDYFNLITNSEIIAINQDPSPQAVLAAQYPSAAQQSGTAYLNVTLQACDLSRPDQRFTQTSGGGIALLGSALNLGLVAVGDEMQLRAQHSPAAPTVFAIKPDDQITFATVTAGGSTTCLTDPIVAPNAVVPNVYSTKCTTTSPIDHHSKSGTPVPFDAPGSLSEQFFMWNSKTAQIVSGHTGKCLTVGMPNYDPNVVHHGQDYTNNGTLQLEVWAGPLTSTATGASRRVIALFNKGAASDTIVAPPSIVGTAGAAMAVRDVEAKKDLPPLAAGQSLSAVVPSHGVRLFVLTVQV